MSDETAEALFSDPAKYDYFNCKQLEGPRAALAAQTDELRRLMAKAETGVAGSFVSTIAYQNDYLKVRAQAKRVDDAWQKQGCSGGKDPGSDGVPRAGNPKGGIY